MANPQPNALFNGAPFRIDPTAVAWSYAIKAVQTKTVGGKVVQIIGSELGDLTVEGTFGVGGWKEQDAMLQRIRAIGDAQTIKTAPPIRFNYPRYGWDFQVYLKAFNQAGAATSVSLSNQTPAPKWQLQLFVASDNRTGANSLAGLHLISQDDFISRLAAGIGWQGLSKWNGLVTFQDLSNVLNNAGVSTVQQYAGQTTGADQVGQQ